MKPKVQVHLEVTDEVVMNGRKQVAYVHLGGQYPEKTEVWCPDNGPYASGNYVADSVFMSNEKYPRLVVGLNQLTKVVAKAG